MDMGLFPGETDEPEIGIKLFGRNMCDRMMLNGWTHDFPAEFPGLQQDLKIKPVDMIISDNATILRQTHLARRQTTLLHMHNGAFQNNGHAIFNPIGVTVVAKRKVDCILKYGSCLVFGTILIADESGHYCVLDLMCDSIPCLYDEVAPGDRILIAAGSYSRSDGVYGGSPLLKEKEVQIVIKVNSLQCRYVYKLPYDVDLSSRIFEDLYQNKKLWFPNELFMNGTSDIRFFENDENPFFDVMGVVSHVGRLERLNRFSTVDAELARENGGYEKNYLVQYTVYRWIELVDSVTATPLPVKIYVNNSTWAVQKRIVPGAVLAISFAQKGESIFGYDHLVTSRFSSIYANEENAYFVTLRPESFQDAAGKFLSSKAARKLLSRTDIQWSAGGSYSMPFKSEQNFVNFIKEREEKNEEPQLYKVPNMFPMERRESQHLYFKGKIIRYRPVTKATEPKWERTNKHLLEQYSHRRCTKIDVIVADKISDLWNVFTRKLPPFQLNPIQKNMHRLQLYRDVSEAHAIYSGPLLMPVTDDPSFLKGLEALDGKPHYMVDIVNEEVDKKDWCRFVTVWKPSRHLSFEQMKQKLDASDGQSLTFLVEVHRLESYDCSDYSSYECILHDFTAAEPSSSQSQSQGLEPSP